MGVTGAGSFVAVDWGTSRFRAYLIEAGAVVDRVSSDEGISTLKAGDHARVLAERCGRWLEGHPERPVVMAGMVGSRNGWVEAPYAEAPAGAAEIAAAVTPVPTTGRPVSIVPGVRARFADGSPDVMRGEEVLVIGSGVTDGFVVQPGTHSKWVEVREGRITGFATFLTGELYGSLAQSFVGRLAGEGDVEVPWRAEGAATAAKPGGPLHLIFQARSRVLDGKLPPEGVRPFLSGLLIASEIIGAKALFGATIGSRVTLVADGPIADIYEELLASQAISSYRVAPEEAFVAGLTRIVETASRECTHG